MAISFGELPGTSPGDFIFSSMDVKFEDGALPAWAVLGDDDRLADEVTPSERTTRAVGNRRCHEAFDASFVASGGPAGDVL